MEKEKVDTKKIIEKCELKFYDHEVVHIEVRNISGIEKSEDGYYISYSNEHVCDREYNEITCLEIKYAYNGKLVVFEILGYFNLLADCEEKILLRTTLALLHSIARGMICSFTSLTGDTLMLPFVNFNALLEDD